MCCFNASIGTSNLQAAGSPPDCGNSRGVSMPQSARATFKPPGERQYLSAIQVSMPQSARATFKQPGKLPSGKSERGFNASIGTSNLQASLFDSYFDGQPDVSMPQSARATFKLSSRTRRWRPARVSMPQSARATFKPVPCRVDNHARQSFNASIGTSNLQA